MTRRAPRGAVAEGEPSAEVAFGTLPEARVPKYDWVAIAKKLKRRPGQWACIFEQDKTTYPSAIRQGSIAALTKAKGFEMRTANNKGSATPRVCDLWLRYCPENDTTLEK